MDEEAIKRLAAKLDDIERRLGALEAGRTNQSPGPVPPPISAEASDPYRNVALGRPPSVTVEAHVPSQAERGTVKPDSGAFEYKVGAKVLPYAGGILVVLGIAFLVTLAFQNHWVTPQVLFGLGVAVCAAFIGTGQKLREEREQFGEILTGTGSAGLYATLASGHMAQHLYDGKTMLVLLSLVSFANLAYGSWRVSRGFWALGGVGGFLSSLAPYGSTEPTLFPHLSIYAAVAGPSLLIAARHRWLWPGISLWVAALLTLIPGLLAPGMEWAKVALLYLTGVLGAYGYCRSFRPSAFDPKMAALPVLLSVTAWIAFEVRDSLPGAAHLFGFGAVLWWVSRRASESPAKHLLWFISVTLPVTLAPWGATKVQTSFILPVVAIGLALYARRTRSARFGPAAMLQALLGGAAYAVAFHQGKVGTWQLEATMLAATIVGIASDLWLAGNSASRRDIMFAPATAAIGLATYRLVFVFIDQGGSPDPMNAPFVVALLVAATTMQAMGAWAKETVSRGLATVMGHIAVSVYFLSIGADMPGQVRVLLAALGVGHAAVTVKLWSVADGKWPSHAWTPAAVGCAVLGELAGHFSFLSGAALTVSTSVVLGLCATSLLLWACARLWGYGMGLLIRVSSSLAVLAFFSGRLALGGGLERLWVDLITAVVLAGTVVLAGRTAWQSETVRRVVSVCLASLLAWVSYHVLFVGAGLTPASAAAAGLVFASAVALASFIVGGRADDLPAALVTWLAAAGMVVFSPGGPLIWETAALIAVQVGLASAIDVKTKGLVAARWVQLGVLFFFWSRLVLGLSGRPEAVLTEDSYLTIGWTVLAFATLALGFVRRIVEARQAGLLLLGVTSAKLVLHDLASGDPVLRVVTTLLLGGAMVGGGFLYVRLKDKLFPELGFVTGGGPGEDA